MPPWTIERHLARGLATGLASFIDVTDIFRRAQTSQGGESLYEVKESTFCAANCVLYILLFYCFQCSEADVILDKYIRAAVCFPLRIMLSQLPEIWLVFEGIFHRARHCSEIVSYFWCAPCVLSGKAARRHKRRHHPYRLMSPRTCPPFSWSLDTRVTFALLGQYADKNLRTAEPRTSAEMVKRQDVASESPVSKLPTLSAFTTV